MINPVSHNLQLPHQNLSRNNNTSNRSGIPVVPTLSVSNSTEKHFFASTKGGLSDEKIERVAQDIGIMPPREPPRNDAFNLIFSNMDDLQYAKDFLMGIENIKIRTMIFVYLQKIAEREGKEHLISFLESLALSLRGLDVNDSKIDIETLQELIWEILQISKEDRKSSLDIAIPILEKFSTIEDRIEIIAVFSIPALGKWNREKWHLVFEVMKLVICHIDEGETALNLLIDLYLSHTDHIQFLCDKVPLLSLNNENPKNLRKIFRDIKKILSLFRVPLFRQAYCFRERIQGGLLDQVMIYNNLKKIPVDHWESTLRAINPYIDKISQGTTFIKLLKAVLTLPVECKEITLENLFPPIFVESINGEEDIAQMIENISQIAVVIASIGYDFIGEVECISVRNVPFEKRDTLLAIIKIINERVISLKDPSFNNAMRIAIHRVVRDPNRLVILNLVANIPIAAGIEILCQIPSIPEETCSTYLCETVLEFFLKLTLFQGIHKKKNYQLIFRVINHIIWSDYNLSIFRFISDIHKEIRQDDHTKIKDSMVFFRVINLFIKRISSVDILKDILEIMDNVPTENLPTVIRGLILIIRKTQNRKILASLLESFLYFSMVSHHDKSKLMDAMTLIMTGIATRSIQRDVLNRIQSIPEEKLDIFLPKLATTIKKKNPVNEGDQVALIYEKLRELQKEQLKERTKLRVRFNIGIGGAKPLLGSVS